MGVTDGRRGKRSRRWKFSGIILPVSLLLFMNLYGCGVNTTSGNTPSAFECNPQGSDVANFTTQVFGTLSATNGQGVSCLTCHGNQAEPPAPFTGNRFRLNTNVTQAAQTEDLCICYQLGQLNPAQELITHPQDAKHDGNYVNGGPWSTSQIGSMITWVQTYRLPTPTH